MIGGEVNLLCVLAFSRGNKTQSRQSDVTREESPKSSRGSRDGAGTCASGGGVRGGGRSHGRRGGDRDGGVGAQDGGRRRRAEWGAWRSRPNKPSKKHIHIESSRKSVCAQQFWLW